MEFYEFGQFHKLLFQNYLPLSVVKSPKPCHKDIKHVKYLEKVVVIRSYSIPTNVILVLDRARRTLLIPLIICSSSPPLLSKTPQITEKPELISLFQLIGVRDRRCRHSPLTYELCFLIFCTKIQ